MLFVRLPLEGFQILQTFYVIGTFISALLPTATWNGEPQLLLGGNMGGGVTAATMRTLGL